MQKIDGTYSQNYNKQVCFIDAVWRGIEVFQTST